jgi:hypothetical protein
MVNMSAKCRYVLVPASEGFRPGLQGSPTAGSCERCRAIKLVKKRPAEYNQARDGSLNKRLKQYSPNWELPPPPKTGKLSPGGLPETLIVSL